MPRVKESHPGEYIPQLKLEKELHLHWNPKWQGGVWVLRQRPLEGICGTERCLRLHLLEGALKH